MAVSNLLKQLKIKRSDVMLGLMVAAIVWAWMIIYALTAFHPKYTATATVMIRDSAITSRYVETDKFYDEKSTSSSATNPVLNTMGLLQSNAIMDAMWDFLRTRHPEELKRLKIKKKKDWESLFQDGRNFIKAKNQPGTDLIALQFKWDDSVVAKEGLETVLTAFQNASREINRAEQRSKAEYLYAQVDEMQASVDKVRGEKEKFKTEKNTVDIVSEGADLVHEKTRLESRLNEIQAAAQGAAAQTSRYQSVLGVSPNEAVKATAVGMNKTLQTLHDEYYQLSQQHAFLKATLTPKNPQLKEVEAKLYQIEHDIQKETSRTLGGSASGKPRMAFADVTRGEAVTQMLGASAESKRLQSEAAVIRQRLSQVNAQLAKMPGLEAQLRDIDQKESSVSMALDALRQKAMEAKIREAQTLSNVFVVDAPRLPQYPSFPTRTHMVAIGLILGMMAGVAALVFKNQVWGQLVAVLEKIGLVEKSPRMLSNDGQFGWQYPYLSPLGMGGGNGNTVSATGSGMLNYAAPGVVSGVKPASAWEPAAPPASDVLKPAVQPVSAPAVAAAPAATESPAPAAQNGNGSLKKKDSPSAEPRYREVTVTTARHQEADLADSGAQLLPVSVAGKASQKRQKTNLTVRSTRQPEDNVAESNTAAKDAVAADSDSAAENAKKPDSGTLLMDILGL
ncbi:MAG: GumC family protein [Candidatus Melainabacteria bacterium]